MVEIKCTYLVAVDNGHLRRKLPTLLTRSSKWIGDGKFILKKVWVRQMVKDLKYFIFLLDIFILSYVFYFI